MVLENGFFAQFLQSFPQLGQTTGVVVTGNDDGNFHGDKVSLNIVFSFDFLISGKEITQQGKGILKKIQRMGEEMV